MENEFISIPKCEFEKMRVEIDVLRNSKVYKRLLEFEGNISDGKKFTREDLGF